MATKHYQDTIALTGTDDWQDNIQLKTDRGTGLDDVQDDAILDSDKRTINSLVFFDNTLVIIGNNNVKDGIFGYRAGQELKDTSDFIEFVQ